MIIFNKGFNYNQDGKGNRLVIHMQGCNFNCPWCSNPEGIPQKGASSAEIDDGEIVKLCLYSKPLYYDGGGVTFTGGEPTLQLNSLKYVLTQLKDNGVSAAIETNGSHPRLPELFPLLTTLIIDLKHYDGAKHKAFTKETNAQTIENIKAAAKFGVKTLVRIPLVNGFNANKEDAQGFIRLLKPLGLDVELLKYHNYGDAKAGKSQKRTENGFVSAGIYNYFIEQMKSNNINVIYT